MGRSASRLSRALSVRLTEGEYDWLASEALRRGLSCGCLLRWLIREAMERAKGGHV